MDQQFEPAMKLLADTKDPNQPVPNRWAVTGQDLSGNGSDSGGSSWITPGSFNVAEDHYDKLKTSGTWDIWWKGWWRDAGWNYEVVVAANLNDSWFNAPGNPWQQFSLGPQYILESLTSPPRQNGVFSPESFLFAGVLVSALDVLILSWQQDFHQWADKIDVSGSDWQGSAAGVFKNTLQTFESQLDALSTHLTPLSVCNALIDLDPKMADAVSALSTAFYDWHGKPENMPSAVLSQVLQDTMESPDTTMHYHGIAHGHPTPTISTQFGDPNKQQFWDQVETTAKGKWRETLKPLDDAATIFLKALEDAYQPVIAAVPTTFVPPEVRSPEPGGSGGGSGDGGGADTPGGSVPDFTLGPPTGSTGSNGGDVPDLDLGKPFASSSSGPSADLEPGDLRFSSSGSAASGGPLGMPAGPTAPGDGITGFSSSGSSGVGGSEAVTGSDGSPLLGPDGLPVTVPAGSTVGPDGEVVGPDGEPVLGPDGKPVTVPAGSSLLPEDNGTTPPTTIGGSGDPAEPETFTPGGPESASATVPGTSGLRTGGGGSFGAIGGSRVPKVSGPGGGAPAPRLVASSGGMSERAARMFDDSRQTSGPGTAGESPAEVEAAQAAAEEEQAISRVPTVGGAGTSGEQTPFMPPMTGGTGLSGGGGGAARKTWVTEDEDTWGTASAGTGVIGRR